MKAIFLILGILTCGLQAEKTEMEVLKSSSPFSYHAEFECRKEEGAGKVVRSGICCPRYFYDLYDEEGEFALRGITRVFSLGIISPYQTEIDIYTAEGRFVGAIKGAFWSNARAKFTFYVGNNEVATAYLHAENPEFALTSNVGKNTLLGTIKGEVFGDFSSWKFFQEEALPFEENFLKIFMAFAGDFDRNFLRKPAVVYKTYPVYQGGRP